MGVDSRRPPLPAPTEPSTLSLSDNSPLVPDDLATDISRRTDRTTYSIPEDGSPVTIPTTKSSERGIRGHQSQTSLLIEYFEAGKTGDKVHSRPSVRVRVTPSSKRKSKNGKDHIEISESRKNRKPSYTRRISLPSSKDRDAKPAETSEVSYSEESNLSGAPVEVEVLQNLSDLSRSEASQGRYVPVTSDISSMPPDSMLEGEVIESPERPRSRSLERDSGVEEKNTLKAPTRRRSRSLSRERITQKVMEKLAAGQQAESSAKHKHSRSLIKELEDQSSPRQRRPSRSRREEALISGTESSLLTASDVSRRSRDDQSIRSGVSNTSSINNPKLLATVEDAIKRLILPEINALKETQKNQHRDKFERATRDSVASASSREDLKRRVSKSSSAPNVSAAKPKVVLNRDGDDPGITLSGDSVKGRKVRHSSRESISDRSYDRYGSEETIRDAKKLHKKHSKDKHRVRDAAVTGALGAGLTAAALHHHDSMSSLDKKEKRHRSSKSKSRSASISESVEEERRDAIPPLPMQSELHSSELTRESILSAETERPQSRSSKGPSTPIREVVRGSPRAVLSPAPSTPTRTPQALRRGSQGELSGSGSVKSERDISSKARDAALAAAGLAAATAYGSREAHDSPRSQHEYSRSPHRGLSPVQSEGSYREGDDGASPMPRSAKSAASMSSAGRELSKKHSNVSVDSRGSSPSVKVARQRRRARGVDMERNSVNDLGYEQSSPRRDEADDFFEHEHEANDAYRAQLEGKRLTGYTDDSLRSSNPLDYNRLTTYTDDSLDGQYNDREAQAVGAKADYIHTPVAVESAVASLHDPSTVSVRTSQSIPLKPGMEHSREYMYEEDPSQDEPHHSSDTIKGHQESPVSQRWSAIKDLAKKHQEANSGDVSPQQSLPRSMRSEEQLEMSANAMRWGEPMPEIGHGLDEESEVTTNPSEIQGPGLVDRWPYEPTPPMSRGQSGHDHSVMHAAEVAAVGAAAAAGVAAGATHFRHDDRESPMQHGRDMQPSVEDDREYEQDYEHEYGHDFTSPNGRYGKDQQPSSPAHWRDEGYISAAQPSYTPEPHHEHSNMFDDSGLPDMAGSIGEEDQFAPAERGMHTRNLSGNSHGMASPLYDSATGKGIDRIQSKDVVALMDHLTVRDAQRNARDTEILVTLVRSAAEMRNSFEEMKRFIAEQDKMIMGNADRNVDLTAQKILQGPRPQPLGSPRTPRRSSEDVDDMPTRRKNVFKRALKGLSGRSSNDLANIEGMLMQLLGEVEGLKGAQGLPRPSTQSGGLSREASMNSYEQMRAGGDTGYEPEGRAGTSSTPNQSGYFSNPSTRQLNGMHSGYDGRRGSPNRISTVLEGDEDLSDHEANVLGHQFENNERLLTPTQEARRSTSLQHTPPREEPLHESPQSQEKTPKSKNKHKSGNSFSSFIPKISRWSKTTASTQNDNTRSSKQEPYSTASRSGSRLDVDYYDDHYALHEDDRIRSSTSLPGHQANTGHPRSPSPLVPEDYMDGPKYQAHRNSLNLEHPQPRPGPTGRHQSQLESQAIGFEEDEAGDSQLGSPDFDQWGSAPSLALNRLPNRFSNNTGNMSPLSEGGYSNHSATEQTRKARDDGPLVPELRVPRGVPMGAGGGLTAKPMYSSPLSSGGLAPLEPIEECRYSLETDRRTLTPSPQPQSQSMMHSPGRKITGPRPMGARSPKGKGPDRDATVIRRKPVGAGDRSPALESYRDSLDSFERDTF
ncbi:hypothetical protein K490DRAFT_65549 [Saccharata proteae CBS 121410]|uniref:Transaldolase n=1 Tax=Saccharata proteae CBS 121410 TaxID=1314787 RepID=A0A9P4LX33_9PEZI|nr:hypothetical protein K490DRAFT_65549 [Saccharata proteae CBS 121410]